MYAPDGNVGVGRRLQGTSLAELLDIERLPPHVASHPATFRAVVRGNAPLIADTLLSSGGSQ